MLEAKISVEQHGCSLAVVTRDNKFELDILSYVPVSNDKILFLSQAKNPNADTMKYLKEIEEHPSTESFEIIQISPEETLFLTVIADASAIHAFEESRCFIKPPIHIKNGNKYYTIMAPDTNYLNQAYEKLKKLGKWSIDHVQRVQDGEASGFDLTEMQAKVLLTAEGMGYFGHNHKVSIEDVGKALGISKSTAHHHLQEAKRKLVQKHITESGL
ncbi:MAG: helix-turn-helix domain-containing protein [Candidatus Methanoperedens sp.]|jgi:hypothetical protein|nr:helix-turn-helix domain-containing protein [Candidatus Methanoperedens sp.]PKL53779.1 MAG: bacteriocin [Candidatus Methanoperedenaceae archaeon HGW-Methanoperedenaceae-1]